ncbi:hypothetical protein QQ045_030892 [Rhodiola kirilowii]
MASSFDLNEAPEESKVEHPEAEHQIKQTRLTSEQRIQVLSWLLNKASAGKLPHGAAIEAADKHKVSTRTIRRIWKTAKQQENAMQSYNVTTKYHNCGRKRTQLEFEAITTLNMGDRSCIRDLASKVGVSKSTVHRLIKYGCIKPHTNSLHPGLSDEHKRTRLGWILKLLQGDTVYTKTEYCPMFDFVHLDEKWFYLTKKSQRVYLAQNERGKHRTANSSKFIPKVMFTAVVARPRFNSEGQCTFDGKIGIFPFTYQEPAKRSSKNREKGTVVTKLVESVNKKVTRSMLINHIIPTIKAKWPQDGAHKTIFIQQDNAKTHITQQDAEWQQEYTVNHAQKNAQGC